MPDRCLNDRVHLSLSTKEAIRNTWNRPTLGMVTFCLDHINEGLAFEIAATQLKDRKANRTAAKAGGNGLVDTPDGGTSCYWNKFLNLEEMQNNGLALCIALAVFDDGK